MKKEDIINYALIALIVFGGMGIYITQDTALITIPNELSKDYDLYFNDGMLKIKQGYSNLGESVWQPYCLSDSRYKTVYKQRGTKYSEIHYEEEDNKYIISQDIYYSKGNLTRSLVITSSGIKDSVTWTPEDQDSKCYLRNKNTELDVTNEGTIYSVNQEKTNITSIQDGWLIFDYSTDIEKLNYVTQYNGKIYYTYKPQYGNIDIDPVIELDDGVDIEKTSISEQSILDTYIIPTGGILGYYVINVYEKEDNCEFVFNDKVQLICEPLTTESIEKLSLSTAEQSVLSQRGVPIYNYNDIGSVDDIKYYDPSTESVIEFDINTGQYKTGFHSTVFTITADLNSLYESYNISSDDTIEFVNVHFNTTNILNFGLVANYPFTKDAKDTSGNGYDLTPSANIIHVHERYDFDNDDDSLTVVGASEINKTGGYNVTTCAWFYIVGNSTLMYPRVITSGAYGFRHIDYNYDTEDINYIVRYEDYDLYGTADSTYSFSVPSRSNFDYKWHHVCVSTNDTYLSAYYDGSLVGTSLLNSSTVLKSSNVFYVSSPTVSINGSIDEVALWNRTLSPTNVKEIFDFGLFATVGNFTTSIIDAGSSVNFVEYRRIFTSTIYKPSNFSCRIRNADLLRPNITDTSLVSYYKLNNNATLGETYNIFVDEQGNFNGTCVICPNSTYGVFSGENASAFDLDNGMINITDPALNISGDFTVSAWIKKSESDSYQSIIAVGIPDVTYDGFYFRIRDNNLLDFRIGNGTDRSTFLNGRTEILNTSWYNVLATYNGTDVLMYVNGNLEDSETWHAGFVSSTTGFFIGARHFNTGDHIIDQFNGTIDEVAIYNRSLSQNEVTSFYNWSSYYYQNTTLTNLNESRYVQAQCLLMSDTAIETPVVNLIEFGYYKETTTDSVQYVWKTVTDLVVNSTKWFVIYFDTNSSSKRDPAYPAKSLTSELNTSTGWLYDSSRSYTWAETIQNRRR